MPSLHFQHMGYRMGGPGIGWVNFHRPPPGVFGLLIGATLFHAKGLHAQHISIAGGLLAPLGRRTVRRLFQALLATLYVQQGVQDGANVEGVTVTFDLGFTDRVQDDFTIIVDRQAQM